MSGLVSLPRVMGHRGAAASAPENTLAGIRRAAACGVSWVEFDVKLTADGVPVLMHDDSLKRTTGRDALASDLSFAEFKALDAGGWFGPDFAGERVPSLAETLALLLELGMLPNIEIKPSPGEEAETVTRTIEVLERTWPAASPPPLMSSFSRISLETLQNLGPRPAPGLSGGGAAGGLVGHCAGAWLRHDSSLCEGGDGGAGGRNQGGRIRPCGLYGKRPRTGAGTDRLGHGLPDHRRAGCYCRGRFLTEMSYICHSKQS